MYKPNETGAPSFWNRACKTLLSVFWMLGLIFGVLAAFGAGDATASTMLGAANGALSISGLLVIFAFPFLLSALAVFTAQPWLLLVMSFAKAFCFGFCFWSMDRLFGSAGWLVCFLAMFSDICSIPVLMWFWLRHISGGRGRLMKDLAVCAALAAVIGSFDYCIVSPFLAAIL